MDVILIVIIRSYLALHDNSLGVSTMPDCQTFELARELDKKTTVLSKSLIPKSSCIIEQNSVTSY